MFLVTLIAAFSAAALAPVPDDAFTQANATQRFAFAGVPAGEVPWPVLPFAGPVKHLAFSGFALLYVSLEKEVPYVLDLGSARAAPAAPTLPKGAWVLPSGASQRIVAVASGSGFLSCASGGSCKTFSPAGSSSFGTVNAVAGPCGKASSFFAATSTGLWSWGELAASAPSKVALSQKGPFTACACAGDAHVAAGTNGTVAYTSAGADGPWRVEFTTGPFDAPPAALAFAANGTLFIGDSAALTVITPGAGGAYRIDAITAGMPFANVTSVAVLDDRALVGSARLGAATMVGIAADPYDVGEGVRFPHLFHGARWLACPQSDALCGAVTAVASVGPYDAVAVRGAGIAVIEHVAGLALRGKAQRYEAVVRARHVRRNGHNVVTQASLAEFGNLATSFQVSLDNDGLYSSLYVAGESLRANVTGDPAAFASAWEAFEAMEFLANVTEPWFSRNGFVARSVYANMTQPPPQTGGQWFNSTSHPGWILKGDTSSDEITGHIFAYHVVYHFLARTAAEKARAARLLGGIVGGIMRNNFTLIDFDQGHPTKWGHWDPAELNSNTNKWIDERGTNSAQMLAWLSAAYDVTGEAAFADAFDNLVEQHGYADNMVNSKLQTPDTFVYFDDELSYFPFFNLWLAGSFSRTGRPRAPLMPSTFEAAVAHSFATTWRQREPMWQFITELVTGGRRAAQHRAAAVDRLRQWPLSLVRWPTKNSDRLDVRIDYRFLPQGKNQSWAPLPRDEVDAFRWQDSVFRLNPDGNGLVEATPSPFLLAYWFARRFGIVGE